MFGMGKELLSVYLSLYEFLECIFASRGELNALAAANAEITLPLS